MPSTNNYLEPRTLAKLQGLRLRASHVVEGFVAGLHRSPIYGFSSEFAEHREYAPGDDIRHLDWKVFARTDKYYLKRFEDETNLICYLVLDVSESMRYQSDLAALCKLEYAQCLAASLAWLVLQQRDAVGLSLIDNRLRHVQRPSGNPTQLGDLLRIIETAPSGGRTDSGRTFHELARRFVKRGVVVIISDLLDDVDSILRGMKRFTRHRHDVIVLHVLDPAEIDFPFRRPTLFRGLEQIPDLLADPRGLRRAYREEFQRYADRLQSGCRAQSIRYHRVRTSVPLDLGLSACLQPRRK